MAEYTYNDINIVCGNERVSNALGKVCYYGYSAKEVLENALNDACKFVLKKVDMDNPKPFGDISGNWYPFMIVKKEETPKYVPFNNLEEFLEASLEHNRNHSLSKVRGIWLRNKEDGTICLITSINEDTNYLYFNLVAESLEDILCNYCFLDGTPCGKLQEGK